MITPMLKGEYVKLANTQQQHESELLYKQNVNGVAVGNKYVGGEDTGEPSLIVLVRQKLAPELLTDMDLVPAEVDGRKTDVIEVGELFAGQINPSVEAAYPRVNGSSRGVAIAKPVAMEVEYERRTEQMVTPFVLTQRVRPAMGGFSVGHVNVTAGTIGTCCYDAVPFPGIPSRYYILSNNHVLANSNAANIGDPILQPGQADGGTFPGDVIGRLSRFIPIQFMTPTTAPLNFVDAAIAEAPFHVINREIYWTGYVRGINAVPTLNLLVQKTGRSTNYTTGRITSLNATVDVNYGNGQVARFARQIITTAMSAPGDSGSLVLDLDERAVGLLFAGSPAVTIINPIPLVQNLLQIRITEL